MKPSPAPARVSATLRMASILLGLGIMLGEGLTVAYAESPDPFPDTWFYDGADRPKDLRDLEGKEAPEISAAEWIGDEVTLEKLRGKVVVLDFWATWCGPCMAAIPKNIELVDKYKDDGLVFIGMHDANSGWDRASSVVSEKGINYAVALDNKESGQKSGESTQAYNLKFWPTYVVIDRDGTVRGAGLMPQHVADAVELLMKEPWDGPVGDDAAASGSSFPDAWYYGGEARPQAYREVENQPSPGVESVAWFPETPKANAWDRRVVVIQFVRPEFGYSMDQLEKMREVIEKFTPQGVAFVAVCDARSDWERMIGEIKQRDLKITVAHDAPHEETPGAGVTSQAFRVRFSPVTMVIDRVGNVRAAGLKTEHLESVINTLMAERIKAPEKPDDAGSEQGRNP